MDKRSLPFFVLLILYTTIVYTTIVMAVSPGSGSVAGATNQCSLTDYPHANFGGGDALYAYGCADATHTRSCQKSNGREVNAYFEIPSGHQLQTICLQESQQQLSQPITINPSCPRCPQIDEAWFKMVGIFVRESNAVLDIFQTPPQWRSYQELYPNIYPTYEPTDSQVQGLSPEGKRMAEIYTQFKTDIDKAFQTHNVPASLLVALIYKESNGDPRAVSSGAAVGIMQFIPTTFIDLGGKVAFNTITLSEPQTPQAYEAAITDGGYWVNCNGIQVSPCNSCDRSQCDYQRDERFKPAIAIPKGAAYLQSLYETDWYGALRGYNCGKQGAQDAQCGKDYANSILSLQKTFEEESVAGASLLNVKVGTRISPGNANDLIRFRDFGGDVSQFEFKPGLADELGTRLLFGALQALSEKARSLGYTQKIVITDLYRSTSEYGSRTSAHLAGNAVDIRTSGLNIRQRLLLIQVALEAGFGEIYHGEPGKASGISQSENQQLKCFWLIGHADHLHLALETTSQPWETCIRQEALS